MLKFSSKAMRPTTGELPQGELVFGVAKAGTVKMNPRSEKSKSIDAKILDRTVAHAVPGSESGCQKSEIVPSVQDPAFWIF